MGGLVLDFLIVTAMSTVDIQSVLPQIIPATIACITGLTWLGVATWYLAPHFLPDHQFERAVCEYGQTTGVISSGLILLKMCDPKQKLPVMESFALKNFAAMPLLFTWLPLTIPIINGPTSSGNLNLMLISTGVLALLIGIWFFYYRPIFRTLAPPEVKSDVLPFEAEVDVAQARRATEKYSRNSLNFM